MYRKHVAVMGFVLIIVMMGLIPVAAQTPTPTPTLPPDPTNIGPSPTPVDNLVLLARANFRMNVRTGPSTRYAILGKINSGDVLTITGKLNDGTWLRVQFNDQQLGWVSTPLVEVIGDLAGAPVVEAEPDALLAGGGTAGIPSDAVVVITRVNANLRAEPTTDADILDVIPFNTQLTILGRNEGNNWVQVSFENQTGWVSSGTVVFTQGNLDNSNVLNNSGNPVESTPDPAAPTEEPTVAPTSTP